MSNADATPSSSACLRHAVAIPFPGRGHINPMLQFCSILMKHTPIHITFIITQEWLDLITTNDSTSQQQLNNNINFLTIPNVLPSEHIRGNDHQGFIESVRTDMFGPVKQVLDEIETNHHKAKAAVAVAVDIIIADTFLTWGVSLGTSRGIPVASFWPMCGSVLSLLYHRNLIPNIPISPLELSERGEEEINCIPGISSIKLKDVPNILHMGMEQTLSRAVEAMECLPNAKFLILRTMYELEDSAITALKTTLYPVPVFPIGPSIPNYRTMRSDYDDDDDDTSSPIEWLNRQPEKSVLYVSLGSFMAVSSDQINELAEGLKLSGNRVLWVARDEVERLNKKIMFGEEERVKLVKWCDQLRVLLHPAVGGFLTHCGWNSTLESVFAGVPVLAWPFTMDQGVDCKMMVEDWGIGWRLGKGGGKEMTVMKDEVCEAVKKVMDLGSEERRIVDENSEKLKEMVRGAVGEDGATSDLQAFLKAATAAIKK